MRPTNIPSAIGRYRVEAWIASGAMGHVYRAHDPVINRPVAVKVLRHNLINDRRNWLERFRREAHAAGHRSHPHIVTVFDFGEEDGTPFLVMEFVDGLSLDARLRQQRLTVQEAITVILQVLDALEFAHANGIIHRDIKPSNVMHEKNGKVKVGDFGVAHVDSSDLTIVGDLIGTPYYMAPEHLWGAPIDHRADLFSTGVVLFESIAGVKPFRGRSVNEIISHMQDRGPENVLDHSPEAPPILRDILSRAMAFDADQRFQTAAEFSQALIALRDTVPAIPPPVIMPAPPPPSPPEPPTQAILSEDILGRLETDLARVIGPVAKIAIRRTIKSTVPDRQEIIQALARYIDNSTDRTKFVQRVETIWLQSTTTPIAQPSIPQQSTIPPNTLSKIENDLTRYIGPIARVLVRRQLSKSFTVTDLVRELANQIPDEHDRTAFLWSCSAE